MVDYEFEKDMIFELRCRILEVSLKLHNNNLDDSGRKVGKICHSLKVNILKGKQVHL